MESKIALKNMIYSHISFFTFYGISPKKLLKPNVCAVSWETVKKPNEIEVQRDPEVSSGHRLLDLIVSIQNVMIKVVISVFCIILVSVLSVYACFEFLIMKTNYCNLLTS